MIPDSTSGPISGSWVISVDVLVDVLMADANALLCLKPSADLLWTPVLASQCLDPQAKRLRLLSVRLLSATRCACLGQEPLNPGCVSVQG